MVTHVSALVTHGWLVGGLLASPYKFARVAKAMEAAPSLYLDSPRFAMMAPVVLPPAPVCRERAASVTWHACVPCCVAVTRGKEGCPIVAQHHRSQYAQGCNRTLSRLLARGEWEASAVGWEAEGRGARGCRYLLVGGGCSASTYGEEGCHVGRASIVASLKGCNASINRRPFIRRKGTRLEEALDHLVHNGDDSGHQRPDLLV